MEERIRRVTVLFSELTFRMVEDERSHNAYTATFEDGEGFQAGVLIERGSRFLELAYSFTFPPAQGQYVREKLEEMLKTCYEYGCYLSIHQTSSEIAFSLYSKIYYSGLTFYSLKDTVRDFRDCVAALAELLEVSGGNEAADAKRS
jgi:hypothetical protein